MDAFGYLATGQTINLYYVYGICVTHGVPRNHVWTLAAGISESRYPFQNGNCPCSNLSHPGNVFPPSFVRNKINTTVNQAIPIVNLLVITFTPLIHSGMGSSVKVSVVAMENLLHGSVWSSQIQQLMILRCACVFLKEAMMTL